MGLRRGALQPLGETARAADGVVGATGVRESAGIAFIRRAETHWFAAWTVAFFGVCYSVYLTTVSLTILGSACPYCLTSLALMASTLALVVWQRPPEIAQWSWLRLSAGRAVLAGLVILVIHGGYIAPQPEPMGPEDPTIRALAEHLSDEGALFYGASWCSHCQEQKRLFGASAVRLPYIECSPGGQGAPQSPSVYGCWCTALSDVDHQRAGVRG